MGVRGGEIGTLALGPGRSCAARQVMIAAANFS
jgi:hypothetical protein